jgi:hypothetical protein
MSKLRGLPPEIRRSALTCNKNGVIIFFSGKSLHPRLLDIFGLIKASIHATTSKKRKAV